MAQLSDLEYLKLSKGRKLGYKAGRFFAGIPVAVLNVFRRLGELLKKGITAIGREIKDIVMTFVNGDWKTKLSYLVMGFGCLARGQILRGLLFLLFEVVFIGYMILSGAYWLSMMPSLGKVGPTETYDEIFEAYEDRDRWRQMMLINIAKAGFFSSDRTIEEYNRDIWKC